MEASKGNQDTTARTTNKRKSLVPLVILENRRRYIIRRYRPHNRRIVYDSSSDEDKNSTKILGETSNNKQLAVPIATVNQVSSDSVKQSENPNPIAATTAVAVKKKLRSKLNL